MSVATSSVVPLVLDGIISTLRAGDYPYDVFESWPGPDGGEEMLFFGEVSWTDYSIPTIKAQRKQRQELASIEWEQWTFGGEGTTPGNCKDVRDRAFDTFEKLQDALADDPSAGVGFPVVQWVQLSPQVAGPVVFGRGWVYRITGELSISARLT